MILSMLLSCWVAFHPFHISVTEIEFDQENKSIEIAQKMFIDDLGSALKMQNGESVDLFSVTEDTAVQKMVERYVESNFSISVNQKIKEYDYLGAEVEGDVIWCFIEIPGVKKLKSLKVRNTALTEAFSDQMNIVHIKAFGNTKSMRLRLGHLEDSIDYR